MSRDAVVNQVPFFIVGSGRSGTTLLRLMIGGHSKIEIPPETWFIEPLVRKFPAQGALSSPQVSRAVEIMTTSYRWPDMEFEAHSLREQAMKLERPGLVDLINLVYLHHLRRSGKRRFGDKTPPYIEILRELNTLYPGAKFINVVRDGRDVAMSHIDLGWKGRCYRRDFDWTRSLRLREMYRHSEIAGQILDLKYEELVSDPERILRMVCDFIGEEFEPGMLDVIGRIDRVPQRERGIHDKLAQRPSTEMTQRWRKLSALECFVLEACLKEHLLRWGYELRFSSSTWNPILSGARWLLVALGPLLEPGIPYLKRRQIVRKGLYI